jgi:ribosomal protein L37AE/L43A
MTTTVCDKCHSQFEVGYSTPQVFKCIGSLGNASENEEMFEFQFTVEVTSFMFNMTNKHFCKECLAKAVFKGRLA